MLHPKAKNEKRETINKKYLLVSDTNINVLPNQPTMIRSYFRVALRNLVKRKGYSFLNILGLGNWNCLLPVDIPICCF
jgi:hypothetical protein